MKRTIARKVAKAEKKPRKKGINPRTKGKSLEYKVRDIMAAWTGEEFSRSPQSGAFGSINKMHELVGDVVCKSANFAYNIECKNCEGWSLEGFLSSDKGPIPKWWVQCLTQAFASQKIPLLIFTKNHSPMFCLTTLEGLPRGLPGRSFLVHDDTLDEFLYLFLLSDLVKTDPKQFIL